MCLFNSFGEILMEKSNTTLEIKTLGCFSISADGKPVTACWPDDAVKIFFCSLLSPLDLYITWDRISRSFLDAPDTRVRRRRLEKTLIRPLSSFLIKELGFNPLVAERDGVRIGRTGIHVDAIEFHTAVVEGLKLLSHGRNVAAGEKFCRADSLYGGSYLPGLSSKIINNTRTELESLYQTAIMNTPWQTTTRPARTGQHFLPPDRLVR